MLLPHYSVCFWLFTGAPAYCSCCLKRELEGPSRARESIHSGGLCAVGNRLYMPYESSRLRSVSVILHILLP